MIPIGAAGTKPAVTTETVLYACPANRTAVAKVYVNEQNGGTPSIDVALSKGGGAAIAADYIFFGYTMSANETLEIGPLVLDAADEIRVENQTDGNVAFNVVGEELKK
jgi:hypothetical protein